MAKDYKKIQRDVFSADFRDFCNKKIVKYLTDVEKFRKFYILAIVIISLITLMIFSYFIYLFVIKNQIYDFRLEIFIIIIGISLNGFIIKHYKNRAKKIILPKLFTYIGDLNFKDKDLYSNKIKEYAKGLELISYFNRFYCDDYITGKYNDIDITIAELDLKHETGSGKNKRVVRVFKGILITFKSFKPFKNNVIIKRDFAIKFPSERRIYLEDTTFEKLFDVYGNDQIEARYLITPAFMNRLIKLCKKPFAKKITVSFEKGMVNICLPSSSDWFEIPITKPATKISNYRAIILELIDLFSIADTLKLDQNIGM